MRRYLPLCLLALMVASPAFGKAKPKGKADTATGSNYAVVQDLGTGGCDVRKIGFQADPPLGVTVLGLYQTEKQADAAKGSSPGCQNKSGQGDSAHVAARVLAVEQDCQAQAKKSDATLLSLLTDLTSGASKQQAYAACMKAHGFNVNQ
ncbi:MAG: hypothetical protein ACRD9W_10040 [Terriglobia bacterium]